MSAPGSEETSHPMDGAHISSSREFIPRRFLRNAHIMTIAGNYLPRKYLLPESTEWFVEVEPASEDRRSTLIRCDCYWQPPEVRSGRLTVVIVHGLEGSTRSRYVLGNAARSWANGCNVVAMNMRSCGRTDELSPGIYHSGLSGDIDLVVKALVGEYKLRSITLVGYSMGGNLVLKYAGELGKNTPPELKAVAGVSPLMDLAASSAALHEPQNRLYEWKFLRGMLRRFRYKAQLFPELYATAELHRIHSMRDFDEHVVARYGGFASADEYYFRVASARVAANICVPTLILHALDDPFIRMTPETRATLLANQNVTMIETNHGGHCAFLSPDTGNDGYWAEKTILKFLMNTASSIDVTESVTK